MANSAFGEHLRREREMRGISLEEVSAATRISMRFLEALEHGAWEQLPGGVFRRGFIRSVATFLGLDEDSLVAEYALETKDSPAPAVPQRAIRVDQRHWLLLLGAAGVLAVVVGGFYGARYLANPRKTDSGRNRPPELTSTIARPVAQNSPAPPAAGGPSPAPNAAAPSSGTEGALISGAPAASEKPPSAPMNGAATASPPAAGAEAELMTLHVQARQDVRIRVIADGKGVFEGTMHEGSWRNFHATQEMEIFATDGTAVQLELNGQPVKTHATVGQPLEMKFPPNT